MPAAFVGWQLLLWGVFTFCMWIATLRSSRALQCVFVALWAILFLLAAGEWSGSAALRHAGGYGGLLTALLASCLSAAEIIKESLGRNVPPVGAKPALVEMGSVSAAVATRFAD